jgi:hypothetical protein
VHSDHDIFIQAIQQRRRLLLTFVGPKSLQKMGTQCAPLHYSRGQNKGDDLDCYYIWDFEASSGDHFLALPPSKIQRMQLSEDTFDIEDIDSRQKEKVN